MALPTDSRTGVYFDRRDYATLSHRLLAGVIDGCLVGTTGLMALVVASLASSLGARSAILALGLAHLAFVFLYFTIVLRSRFRTAGLRIAGLKVVSVDGGRPSVWSLGSRLIVMAAPGILLADLWWMLSTAERQTLRDRLAGCYVVRADAAPLGRGVLMWEYLDGFGLALLLRSVRTVPDAR